MIHIYIVYQETLYKLAKNFAGVWDVFDWLPLIHTLHTSSLPVSTRIEQDDDSD